jgi:hypothetical protein
LFDNNTVDRLILNVPGTADRNKIKTMPGPLISIVPALIAAVLTVVPYAAEIYDAPDRGKPGDEMIQKYLAHAAVEMEKDFLGDIKSAEDWEHQRVELKRQYFEMLGLSPEPTRSDLKATVTRTLDRGDYLVEMLHYQSRPGLYVTGNLYKPAKIATGEKLPAIFYVCGHSSRGRNGNKTAFQSHGIWLARHGYICLIVDTLQLGELAGIHHGTYREGRWWWLSRGYTPAGVECWNGVRGIDYLASRPDVDPERIGVTGISGGGAATYWIAAADDRVKVAVPVSGMADLVSYVQNRVVDGHCDCMFLYNSYQWHWTRIASLIAPRPLLFVNSDHDLIFPMDANERVINNLERLYSLWGKGDQVDALVSVGGHDYRKDIRQSAFRFLNTYLKSNPQEVKDSEIDLVTGPKETVHPIEPEQLRVFPSDSDIPKDAKNATIDREFVPLAKPELPDGGNFDQWKNGLMGKLRRMTFHHFPERIPAATEGKTQTGKDGNFVWLNTEPGISCPIKKIQNASGAEVVLFIPSDSTQLEIPVSLRSSIPSDASVYICEPRGLGETEWTRKSPPNYVDRAHYLLGRTVDSGRVWDIAAIGRYLHERENKKVCVVAEKNSAVLATYAALLEPDIDRLILSAPATTLNTTDAPVLLNALRVCDVQEILGMFAPRGLTIKSATRDLEERVITIYATANASQSLRIDN